MKVYNINVLMGGGKKVGSGVNCCGTAMLAATVHGRDARALAVDMIRADGHQSTHGGYQLDAADQLADSISSVSLKKLAMDPLEPRFEMSFIKNHHQAIRRRALGNEIQG